MNQIKVELLRDGAKLPQKAHPGDTCWDVCWCPGDESSWNTNFVGDYLLPVGPPRLLGTGLRIEVPDGYGIQVRPRSGLACKYTITVLNSPGTIDQHYRGELKIMLWNKGHRAYIIKPGERIAQICLEKLVDGFEFIAGDVSTETDRGEGGFGSSGK